MNPQPEFERCKTLLKSEFLRPGNAQFEKGLALALDTLLVAKTLYLEILSGFQEAKMGARTDIEKAELEVNLAWVKNGYDLTNTTIDSLRGIRNKLRLSPPVPDNFVYRPNFQPAKISTGMGKIS